MFPISLPQNGEDVAESLDKPVDRRSLLKGIAGLGAGAILATTVGQAAASSTDTRIVNTSGARLRSGPGTGYAVVASLPKGIEVRYLANGGSANGYEWHKVMVLAQSAQQGFIAANLLSLPGSSPGGGNHGPFGIGAKFWVKVANANLRSGAGTNYGVIKVLPRGSQGTVIAGTVAANGYTWYQVTVGAATGWLATTVMGATPGNPGGVYNVTVLNGPLNIRKRPSTSAAIVGTVQTGHRGRRTPSAFIQADGHQWVEVSFESARELGGWVSTKYLKIT